MGTFCMATAGLGSSSTTRTRLWSINTLGIQEMYLQSAAATAIAVVAVAHSQTCHVATRPCAERQLVSPPGVPGSCVLAPQICLMAVPWAVLFVCALVPVVSAPVSAPDVCALFRAGATVLDIATRYTVTVRRVQQIVREAGLRPDLQPQPSEAVLDQIMAAETARFGPNYGFGMLHGALLRLYPQWCFTRRAVYASLRRVAPAALRSRRAFAQYRLRRGHYHAPHFQYSCHLDLACKLQEYGLFVGL